MSDQFIQSFHRTFKAQIALPNANRVVKVGTGDNEVTLATAASDNILGIIAAPATLGQSVRVHFLGTFPAEAGAAITKGAMLTTDASGRVIATTTATNRVIGIALEAAGAAGDLIEVFFTPGKVY